MSPRSPRLGLALLGTLLLASPALAACSSGKYLIESTNKCVTKEECEGQTGRQVREGGYCREVYEVSTVEELRAMADHPYEACVLTADITLSGPIMPIDFRGELDGQGHWIKSIDFDIKGMYGGDTGSSKDIRAGLFTNPKSLINLGLEFKVDFINTIGKIGSLYLGSIKFAIDLTVSNVIVNGSLSARNGSGTINKTYIGGIIGYSRDESSTLGPNVTSYCNLECKAGSCFMGGLAGVWSGEITGVAAILDSITVDAFYVLVGGVAGYSESAAISESFADVGEITVTVGDGHGAEVGGFVGVYEGAEVRDSYASVSSISVTSSRSSSGGIRASPFIAWFPSDTTASIVRCYSWVGKELSVDASSMLVIIGGLVGWLSSSSSSVSASFSYVADVKVVDSKGLFSGGLCGSIFFPSNARNTALDIHDVRAVFRVSSISATPLTLVGGLCGYSDFGQSNAKLRNLDITLYMDPDIAGRPTTKLIGALAGYLDGSISAVLLNVECLGSKCAPIPLVASGTTTLFGVYAIDNGWKVTKGTAKGEVAKVDPNTYDKASYEGLSPSDWVFYKSHYPTLSRLPVRGMDGSFSNPKSPTWSSETWVIPEAQHCTPQLVGSKR